MSQDNQDGVDRVQCVACGRFFQAAAMDLEVQWHAVCPSCEQNRLDALEQAEEAYEDVMNFLQSRPARW